MKSRDEMKIKRETDSRCLNKGHDQMNLLAKNISQANPFKGATLSRRGTKVVQNSSNLNTEWETGLQLDR